MAKPIGLCFNCWGEMTGPGNFCGKGCRDEAKATGQYDDVKAYMKGLIEREKARCRALGVPISWRL